MAEKGRALLGDADAARGAVEEARGKLVLERLDALRDRARRQAQFGADRGQVLHRRDAGKNAHVLDVHALLPERRRFRLVFVPAPSERRRSSIIIVPVGTVAANLEPVKQEMRRHVPSCVRGVLNGAAAETAALQCGIRRDGRCGNCAAQKRLSSRSR